MPATTTHASLENITAGAHTVTAMDFADVTTTGGAADLSGVTVYPENAPFVRNGAGSFNITGLAGATGSGALPVTGAPANVVVAATLTGTTVAVTVTDNRTSGNAITFDVKIGAGSIYARITLPAVVAATNIPSNWTVDGLSNFGEIEIERQLTNNSGMTILGDSGTGADGNAVLAFLQPDYFLWRVPNTALTTQSGSGWTGGLTWADLQAQTIASITPPAGNSQTVLRSAHFNRAQLRTTRTVGFSNVVRDVRFHFHNNNTTRIQVRSVEFLTRTGDNDVEFDLSLAVTGASTARMGRAWLTVANEEIEVWDDQEFIDPSHQQFITADGTIRGLEIYAGNNMYVTRNITSGQELYIATELATHDDVFTELFREHRDLIDVIRVHTSTGWGAAGIDVRFDVADTLFVFGGPNRALLGTTDDRSLPMSEYYFLARSLINLGGAADGGTDAPVEDNNDDGFDGVPGTGGDVAPPNANFNPGTGR
ncbi:MAG: hypothetical protein FWE32_05595 [Oscillospiraceae bacterium]|nr:hypothetical protein [Oscillospiraceae bacterium]